MSVVILVPRLHLPHRRIEHSIDYLGSALLTFGLAALVVLATAGGKDVDWVSPESGALALVLVACGVAFVWRERHAAEPFVPLRLFQNPVLRIAAPVNFTSGLLFYLGVFFLPVFFQEVAGVDADGVGPPAHPVHDRHRDRRPRSPVAASSAPGAIAPGRSWAVS